MKSAAPPSRRVLVVDDDLDTAESLAYLLRDMGHRVEFAISARAALEVAGRFRPQVVVLDLGLPDMDGYDLGKHLKSQPALEGLHVVVVTGRSAESDRKMTANAGFDAHMVKPVDATSLESMLARLGRQV